jgi:hypothetical protein
MENPYRVKLNEVVRQMDRLKLRAELLRELADEHDAEQRGGNGASARKPFTSVVPWSDVWEGLKDRPQFSLAEIKAEIEARGFSVNPNTVKSRTGFLVKKGFLERVAPGLFRVKTVRHSAGAKKIGPEADTSGP